MAYVVQIVFVHWLNLPQYVQVIDWVYRKKNLTPSTFCVFGCGVYTVFIEMAIKSRHRGETTKCYLASIAHASIKNMQPPDPTIMLEAHKA